VTNTEKQKTPGQIVYEAYMNADGVDGGMYKRPTWEDNNQHYRWEAAAKAAQEPLLKRMALINITLARSGDDRSV
jgi:hypothetical protein